MLTCAKGQRTDIFYGNGSKTKYEYDPNTFRLTRLLTTRNTGSDVLQDLNYTYDPVGNIVEMVDDAQQTHYFSNTVIDPKSKYQYDALYRLLKATGREKDSLPMPSSGGYTPDFVATDGQSSDTFRTYCQQFTYDALGNIQQLSHRATCGGTEHWKRNYQYNTNTPNNYLLSTYTGSTPPGTPEYTYDNHGNMLEMPHLTALNWDFADQLKSSEKTDETTHCVYSGGERVRKVVMDTSGGTDKIKYERIYLGGYEIYREYDSSENLDLERETHHIMDDQRKIALLEVKTVNNGSSIPNGSRTTIARYQYTNHLDSACLELNDSAEILSYEEYHPFGTTSYSLHTNDSEVSLKRYKYVHKERDDESGLYYYGARYYAAWLCRFVSVDPLKDKYPFYSTYQYAGNKPVSSIDKDGLEAENKVEDEEVGQEKSSEANNTDKNEETRGLTQPDRVQKETGATLVREGEGPTQIAKRLMEEYGVYVDWRNIAKHSKNKEFFSHIPEDELDNADHAGYQNLNLNPGDTVFFDYYTTDKSFTSRDAEFWEISPTYTVQELEILSATAVEHLADMGKDEMLKKIKLSQLGKLIKIEIETDTASVSLEGNIPGSTIYDINAKIRDVRIRGRLRTLGEGASFLDVGKDQITEEEYTVLYRFDSSKNDVKKDEPKKLPTLKSVNENFRKLLL